MKRETELQVEGKGIKVTNLDKVIYPKAGFTKGQVIDYYIRISPWLLPHLKNRPLTLKRYPNGVEKAHFYEKSCPSFRPKWVQTTSIPRRLREEPIVYCMANNLPTLVWAANLADIELHITLGQCRNPLRPTTMVFDLDPGPPAHIMHCVQVAFWLRQILEPMGLNLFPKTSGSKGLQIYVPFNTAVTFEQTRLLAKTMAEWLEQQHPKEVVSKMGKQSRAGKVFVDWSQNVDFKTTVAVYSLRAKERPTVSTPVTWQELEQAHRRGRMEDLVFQWDTVLARVSEEGDLFAPVLTLKQKFPRWQETALAA